MPKRVPVDTAVAVAAAGAAFTVFELARPPGQDVSEMLPLLERRGAWPHHHLTGLEPARRLELLGEIAASAGHACEPHAGRSAAFVSSEGCNPLVPGSALLSSSRGGVAAATR